MANRRVGAEAIETRIELVRSPSLSAVGWLLHAFSTRVGGRSTAYSDSSGRLDLNLGYTTSHDAANVAENRQRFLEAVTGDPHFPMITLRQIHSSIVVRMNSAEAADSNCAEGDGMMTDRPGLLLAIQTADCIPVLVADRKRRAVAGFHAGWRGTLKRIVEHGVERMRMEFGSQPDDLMAAIGPGIGPCCYSVGEEVRAGFESQFAYAAELFREIDNTDPVKEKYPLLTAAPALGQSRMGPPPHLDLPGMRLDLVEANRRQLLDAGLQAGAISIVGDCTSCHTSRYFSYRAERGSTGRMLSVIGIRPEADS